MYYLFMQIFAVTLVGGVLFFAAGWVLNKLSSRKGLESEDLPQPVSFEELESANQSLSEELKETVKKENESAVAALRGLLTSGFDGVAAQSEQTDPVLKREMSEMNNRLAGLGKAVEAMDLKRQEQSQRSTEAVLGELRTSTESQRSETRQLMQTMMDEFSSSTEDRKGAIQDVMQAMVDGFGKSADDRKEEFQALTQVMADEFAKSADVQKDVTNDLLENVKDSAIGQRSDDETRELMQSSVDEIKASASLQQSEVRAFLETMTAELSRLSNNQRDVALTDIERTVRENTESLAEFKAGFVEQLHHFESEVKKVLEESLDSPVLLDPENLRNLERYIETAIGHVEPSIESLSNKIDALTASSRDLRSEMSDVLADSAGAIASIENRLGDELAQQLAKRNDKAAERPLPKSSRFVPKGRRATERSGIYDVARVFGIGPVRAEILWDEYDIHSLEEFCKISSETNSKINQRFYPGIRNEFDWKKRAKDAMQRIAMEKRKEKKQKLAG